MKNRKFLSRFLVPTLVVGIFGLVAVTNVLAAPFTVPETQTQINNVVPAFTTHTTESWTQTYIGGGTPEARTASSAEWPTNEGANVVFTATATDSNNDDYYLIVCGQAIADPTNNGAPTCQGEITYCVSASTDSGQAATCSFDTDGSNQQTLDWYAYVCDYNAASICSLASNTSQGQDNDETGGTPAGSPFHVNHVPTFTAADITAVNPGTAPTFANSEDADGDTQGTQDTFSLYVCSGEADQGGVTTAFDYKTKACTGGTILCSDTLNGTGDNATCNDTTSINAVPRAHATDYSVQFYVVDSHDFGTAVQAKDYTVNDVAPVSTGYTVDSDITLTADAYTTINLSFSYSDDNGDNDPTAFDLKFFDTTDACTADENDCYTLLTVDPLTLGTVAPAAGTNGCYTTTRSTPTTHKFATGIDKDITITCDITIWFNANASTTWNAGAFVTDNLGAVNFVDSANMTVPALSAIGVQQTVINYGTVAVGQDSDPFQVTSMQNLGNTVIDVLISGTQMCTDSPTCTGNTIAAAQQHFHHSGLTFTWDTEDDALLTSATAGQGSDAGCLNRDLAVRNTNNAGLTASEDEDISWIIRIPAAQESGSYTGTNTFAYTSACTGTLY